jgi:hypothetical protein
LKDARHDIKDPKPRHAADHSESELHALLACQGLTVSEIDCPNGCNRGPGKPRNAEPLSLSSSASGTAGPVGEADLVHAVLGHAFDDNTPVGDPYDPRVAVSLVSGRIQRIAWIAGVMASKVAVTNDRADPVGANLDV